MMQNQLHLKKKTLLEKFLFLKILDINGEENPLKALIVLR